jgi:hypothetical protein
MRNDGKIANAELLHESASCASVGLTWIRSGKIVKVQQQSSASRRADDARTRVRREGGGKGQRFLGWRRKKGKAEKSSERASSGTERRHPPVTSMLFDCHLCYLSSSALLLCCMLGDVM